MSNTVINQSNTANRQKLIDKELKDYKKYLKEVNDRAQWLLAKLNQNERLRTEAQSLPAGNKTFNNNQKVPDNE